MGNVCKSQKAIESTKVEIKPKNETNKTEEKRNNVTQNSVSKTQQTNKVKLNQEKNKAQLVTNKEEKKEERKSTPQKASKEKKKTEKEKKESKSQPLEQTEQNQQKLEKKKEEKNDQQNDQKNDQENDQKNNQQEAKQNQEALNQEKNVLNEQKVGGGGYNLNDSVKTKYGCGIIKWIGKCKYFYDSFTSNDSYWYGIELLSKNRKDNNTKFHDGLYKGRRFFACQANNGIYIQKDEILAKLDDKLVSNNLHSCKLEHSTIEEYMRHYMAEWRKKKHKLDTLIFKTIPEDCKPTETTSEHYTHKQYGFQDDKNWYHVHEIINHSMWVLTYNMDYSACENFEIESPLFKVINKKVVAVIQPYEKLQLTILTRSLSKSGKFGRSGRLEYNQCKDKHVLDLYKRYFTDKITEEYINSDSFVDDSFYPCLQNGRCDNENVNQKLSWMRSVDFCKATPKYFDNGIHPLDARQGQLGDCWFISSLSSLAERPNIIEKLFLSSDKQYNDDNKKCIKHTLQLYHNGMAKIIELDDYFPCNDNKPAFTRTLDDELWVALIEKAYAKLYGNYFNLIAGYPVNALADLTGCPSECHKFNDDKFDKNKLWKNMLEWCKNDEHILVSSSSTSGCSAVGLKENHAYSVLDCKEHENIKLIKIRNPWGHGEWKGDFRDNDKLWTKQLKQICNIKEFDDNDGIFWMKLQDYVTYFRNITVCYALRNYAAKRIEINSKLNKMQTIKLTVNSGCTLEWLGLHQQDTRELNVPNLSDLCAFIFDEQFNCIASTKSKIDRQIFKKLQLNQGVYYVVPYMTGCNWDNNLKNSKSIAISAHGFNAESETNDFFKLELLSTEFGKNHDILNNLLSIVINDIGNWTDNGQYATGHLYLGSLLLYGVKNNHKERTFHLSMDSKTNGTHFEIARHFENDEKIITQPTGCVNMLNVLICCKPGGKSVSSSYGNCKYGDIVEDITSTESHTILHYKKGFVHQLLSAKA